MCIARSSSQLGVKFMQLLSRIVCLSFFFFLPTFSIAGTLTIDNLEGEDCSFVDEQSQNETIGYWRRHPPFVGYHKGEKLLAGGDGTCVLGFPKSKDHRALISMNGKKVAVYPVGDALTSATRFKSRDGLIQVELKMTGTESTCAPNADMCCGDYTFVTISVSLAGQKSFVRAVTYAGG
jgi:hypothetical protein